MGFRFYSDVKNGSLYYCRRQENSLLAMRRWVGVCLSRGSAPNRAPNHGPSGTLHEELALSIYSQSFLIFVYVSSICEIKYNIMYFSVFCRSQEINTAQNRCLFHLFKQTTLTKKITFNMDFEA